MLCPESPSTGCMPTSPGALPLPSDDPDVNRVPTPGLADAEVAALQALLERVPAPLEPLDASGLDGFLCGVLVQPRPVPERAWWPRVLDIDGRAAPPRFDPAPLRALVRRRHAELAAAIGQRRWFDPWVFASDADGDDDDDDKADDDNDKADDDNDKADDGHLDAVRPWAVGFAIALETFDELLGSDEPATTGPLALVYARVGAEHLEDAEALHQAIEALEPPADLATAVEEMVRATLLLADAAGVPSTRR